MVNYLLPSSYQVYDFEPTTSSKSQPFFGIFFFIVFILNIFTIYLFMLLKGQTPTEKMYISVNNRYNIAPKTISQESIRSELMQINVAAKRAYWPDFDTLWRTLVSYDLLSISNSIHQEASLYKWIFFFPNYKEN